MKISFYAQVEIPVDERFSRSISTTVTLESEAILELAKAITAAQQTFAPDVCPVCLGKKLVQTKSRGVIKIIKCASCNGTGQRR